MDNLEKLKDNFVQALGIDANEVKDDLSYDTNEKWDSMRHMELVTQLEQSFDIMMDTDDIIDMSSFAKAKEILKEKYDIAINA
jgi:acyl carrier protein